jgi:small subunit ribosomal protein S2
VSTLIACLSAAISPAAAQPETGKRMAIPTFTMRQLLEAGVHFGHHTRRWNPKMAPYIFGVRNGIHIIDLEQTDPMLHQGLQAIRDVVAGGGRVLLVGTKRQAQEPVAEAAKRCGQYFVNYRWLGGMLTNFKTIRQSIKRLGEITELATSGALDKRGKKEATQLRREMDKLEKSLGGIKNMESLPDAMFVVDVGHEKIAIHEAKKLGIPVVAIVDTNCSPDGIDYVVPGNDDAMRAIQLYATGMADAVIEGKASVPTVAVGEDEFVELDEQGNPRKKAARGRPRPQASVRKKAPTRRRPAAIPTPAVGDVTDLADEVDDDLDVVDPAEVAAVVGLPPAPPAAERRPTGGARPSGGARRGGGRGPSGGRGQGARE